MKSLAGPALLGALLVAALSLAASLVAQQPPAPDTLAPQLIFDDVFSPNGALPAYVVLSEGVVYRVEVMPGTADFGIRVRRHPSLPPLLMTPLSREALESGSAAFLIVPHASEEYRLDVAPTGDEPVRIRIWRDPKESARFARIRTEGFRAPPLAAALRAVYLAPFRDAYASPLDSALGYHIAPQAAYGVEGCLAVMPNGRVLPDRVGGCAITLGFWYRGGGRSFYTIGMAPEVVVLRRGAAGLSVSPQIAFGSSRGGKPSSQYVLLGLGARYTVPLGQSSKEGYEFEATVLNVRSQPAAPDPRRVSTFTLRLGAGLMVSF